MVKIIIFIGLNWTKAKFNFSNTSIDCRQYHIVEKDPSLSRLVCICNTHIYVLTNFLYIPTISTNKSMKPVNKRQDLLIYNIYRFWRYYSYYKTGFQNKRTALLTTKQRHRDSNNPLNALLKFLRKYTNLYYKNTTILSILSLNVGFTLSHPILWASQRYFG